MTHQQFAIPPSRSAEDFSLQQSHQAQHIVGHLIDAEFDRLGARNLSGMVEISAMPNPLIPGRNYKNELHRISDYYRLEKPIRHCTGCLVMHDAIDPTERFLVVVDVGHNRGGETEAGKADEYSPASPLKISSEDLRSIRRMVREVVQLKRARKTNELSLATSKICRSVRHGTGRLRRPHTALHQSSHANRSRKTSLG